MERPPLFFYHEGKKALRQGDWKITTIESGGAWELYDLASDRGETRDLSAQYPDRLKQMVSLWEARQKGIVEQIGAREE